jgi:hypothetical protein
MLRRRTIAVSPTSTATNAAKRPIQNNVEHEKQQSTREGFDDQRA